MTDTKRFATHQDLNRVESRVDALGQQLSEGFEKLQYAITELSTRTTHVSARSEGDVQQAIERKLAERDDRSQRARLAIVSLSITVFVSAFAGLWWSVESQTKIATLQLELRLSEGQHAVELVNQEQTDTIEKILEQRANQTPRNNK